MPTLSSQPENREQTFEQKLDGILLFLCNSSSQQSGKGSPTYGMDYQQTKQAIRTLILEDVIGEDEFEEYKMSAFLSMLAESNNILRAEQRQIINPQKEES